MQHELFSRLLKDNNQSLTKARLKLFEILSTNPPLTIRQLIENLDTQTDRSSVYRNLDLFEKIGITRRINSGRLLKIELSHIFDHHHHAHCLSCEKIIKLNDNLIIEDQIKKMANNIGLQLKSHSFELEGICLSCKKKNKQYS